MIATVNGRGQTYDENISALEDTGKNDMITEIQAYLGGYENNAITFYDDDQININKAKRKFTGISAQRVNPDLHVFSIMECWQTRYNRGSPSQRRAGKENYKPKALFGRDTTMFGVTASRSIPDNVVEASETTNTPG